MCLGRLHTGLILKAFELGADGVLLLGCPPGECHYEFGNQRAEELFQETRAIAHLLGIEDERLKLDWEEAPFPQRQIGWRKRPTPHCKAALSSRCSTAQL